MRKVLIANQILMMKIVFCMKKPCVGWGLLTEEGPYYMWYTSAKKTSTHILETCGSSSIPVEGWGGSLADQMESLRRRPPNFTTLPQLVWNSWLNLFSQINHSNSLRQQLFHIYTFTFSSYLFLLSNTHGIILLSEIYFSQPSAAAALLLLLFNFLNRGSICKSSIRKSSIWESLICKSSVCVSSICFHKLIILIQCCSNSLCFYFDSKWMPPIAPIAWTIDFTEQHSSWFLLQNILFFMIYVLQDAM